MADLTGLLEHNSPEIAINLWYESQYKSRTRLGLSEIGHPCKRYLWYRHNGYIGKQPDGQKLRLFKIGDLLENQIIGDLVSAGYTVDSRQKEIEFSLHGITLKGHIDGVISGLIESKKPHLLECKSAGEKGFKDLIKVRSYEKWSQKYKGQIQVYMLGCHLDRCLAVVYNKNTSKLYTERIKLNKEYAINLLSDVFFAISRQYQPLRACPRVDYFEAKWCDFYEECWR